MYTTLVMDQPHPASLAPRVTPAPRMTDDASNLLMLGAVVLLLVLAVIFLYARKKDGGSKDHHDSHRLEPGDYYSGFNRHQGSRWPRAGRHTWAVRGPACSPPWASWCMCPCPAGQGQTPDRLCRCPCV